jgi:hypothetical protein
MADLSLLYSERVDVRHLHGCVLDALKVWRQSNEHARKHVTELQKKKEQDAREKSEREAAQAAA